VPTPPAPSALTAVFLDLDDTLFDRRRAQIQVVPVLASHFPDALGAVPQERVLAALLESDDQTMREYEAGLPLAELSLRRFVLFAELLGLDSGLAETMHRAYAHAYPRLDVPVDGARELVRALRPRYRLGIISNGFAQVQHAKIDTLGIGPCLDCVVLSGEVGMAKPDPRVFALALDAVGASPAQALHVGDSYRSDVAGALDAGLAACWLNPEQQPVPDGAPPPTFEIRALGELPALLGV
jgi:HAD superfamily hydrolase (TIGR01509 family)